MVIRRGPLLWTELGPLVSFAQARSRRGLYDGTSATAHLIDRCRHFYRVSLGIAAQLIYTRDIGHHSSGWWKNPDYERCLHLSLSFMMVPSYAPLPFDKRPAFKIAVAFFGDDVRKAWVEPPFTREGKITGVHHYRVFCDAGWQPLLPRGEVYDKRDTPADWKSFSELHGWTPTEENAPWLKAASE